MIDLSRVQKYYVACGLYIRYFYPYLFDKALIIAGFLLKDKDKTLS
ncbi:hypothetical protein PMF13cell1_00152 [Blautia producta]|uniref:Uncharacterized protein n=1 Tax=Blautia producta TaxID=33035 RepID=A0A4P6LS28_9FIRM|nr:hypothetical protein PMF13cell1_00152 [Blautia producta]